MTTPWNIEPDWKGCTVAVLGSGPGLTAEVAQSLRRFRSIAVNHSHRLAPDADMLVAMDLNLPLWEAAKDFKGLKICGVASEKVDALCPGPMYENVELGPCHSVQVHNSGLAAIRIAAKMGASKIVLAGFNPDQPGYFEGHPGDGKKEQHCAVAAGLKALVKELERSGIEVSYFVQEKPQQAPVKRAAVRMPAKGKRVGYV